MADDPQQKSPHNGSGETPGPAQTVSPTSQDVARLAKVSRATVSYVLNDVPNARVSDATRERVLQAAEELGYVPHEMASSLRAKRNDLVLLPFFDWPYNPSSIAFLQELAIQLDRLGYSVLLRFFGIGDKNNLARKIAAFHPAGVIVVAEELTKADVDLLSRNGVRAILAYGRAPGASIPSISVDFTQVGEVVANYLIDKGHRQIAAIVPQDPRILHLGLQRLEGLERVACQHGLVIERIDLDFNNIQAAQLANRWKQAAHPSAVFCYNDEYALLLMSALQNAGFRVPQDIALVGCDNLPLCEMVRPRITSVALPPTTPAKEITAYFDQMIRGENNETTLNVQLSCEILARESS